MKNNKDQMGLLSRLRTAGLGCGRWYCDLAWMSGVGFFFLAKARSAGFVTPDRVKEVRAFPLEITPGPDANSRELVFGIADYEGSGEMQIDEDASAPAGEGIEVRVPVDGGKDYLRVLPR